MEPPSKSQSMTPMTKAPVRMSIGANAHSNRSPGTSRMNRMSILTASAGLRTKAWKLPSTEHQYQCEPNLAWPGGFPKPPKMAVWGIPSVLTPDISKIPFGQYQIPMKYLLLAVSGVRLASKATAYQPYHRDDIAAAFSPTLWEPSFPTGDR